MLARIIAAAALIGISLSICGCEAGNQRAAAAVSGGDPRRGAAAVSRYGCGSCHTIAGIPGAHGLVGPPLTGIGNRLYVAGVLRNTPDNLERWVQDPKAVNEKTVMPKLGVTQQDAIDLAAYLYSLK
jgi:cytochrome c2